MKNDVYSSSNAAYCTVSALGLSSHTLSTGYSGYIISLCYQPISIFDFGAHIGSVFFAALIIIFTRQSTKMLQRKSSDMATLLIPVLLL